MKRNKTKKFNKLLTILVAMTLAVGLIIGGSVAFLTDSDDEIANTFTPSQVTTEVVETFNGTTKSNVSIKNTGNTDANIRAAVVVTWQNEKGEVWGKAPVAGTDYNISFNTAEQSEPVGKWTQKADGFYYWSAPVAPGANTGILITECTAVEGKAPAGYALCVEIIASGIQAVGIPEGSHPWFD